MVSAAAASAVTSAAVGTDAAGHDSDEEDEGEGAEEEPKFTGVELTGEVRDIMARFKARAKAEAEGGEGIVGEAEQASVAAAIAGEERKEGEGKEVEGQEREGKEGEGKEGEGKEGEGKEGEGKKGKGKEIEGKEGEGKEGEGKEGERKEGERKEGERKEGERKEEERKEGEGKEVERKEGEEEAATGEDGDGHRHGLEGSNDHEEEEGEDDEDDDEDDDDDDDDEDEEHEYLMVRSGTPGDDDGVIESKAEGSQAEEKGDEGSHGRSTAAAQAAVAAAASDALKRDRQLGAMPGQGEAAPEIGLGEYLLKVVYIKGATMRDGVEIDNAAVVGNLPFGTTTVATNRTICSCGIPRFKTQRGWISEWLRGGMEELVVEVLHHKPRKPIKYQVICTGGAMVRETANISGPEARGSGCKKGTVVGVAERLRLADGTMRLRVVEPAENVGWISEKDHIVRLEVRSIGGERVIERAKLIHDTEP